MYDDLPELISLDNGLKLVIQNRPGHPGVHIRANVKMGACDERLPRDKGICNLIERLCWRGSEKMSAAKVIESSSLGGQFTGGNVGRAYTTYHTWCPTKDLHVGLAMLDNIIFRPRMDSGDLDLEKRLAIMRIGSHECDPMAHATEVAISNLYPNHRVSFGLLGTPETVTNMKVTRMRELVRGSHRPQTVTMGLAGSLQPFGDLEVILGKHAGGFVEKTRAANAIPLNRDWGEATANGGGHECETWGYREDWTTVLIYPVPGEILRQDGRVLLSIICRLVGSGMASVLWQRLVMNHKSVTSHDVTSDYEWLDGIAWVRIIIQSSGERGSQVPQMVENCLSGHLVNRLRTDDIAHARSAVRADMTSIASDPMRNLETTLDWMSLGTARRNPNLDLSGISKVSDDDVRSAVEAIFGEIGSGSICSVMR